MEKKLKNVYNGIKHRVLKYNIPIHTPWIDDRNTFIEWCIQNGYSEEKTLFRVEPELGYFPSNCIWALNKVGVVKSRKTIHSCIETTCTNTVARKNTRCRTCSSIEKRKYKELDRDAYRRNWSLLKKYNISLEVFNNMYFSQDKQCAICKKEMKLPTKSRGQDLDTVAVDHCHETGIVRKLLCNGCNKGLGLFLDNITILQSALNYIKEFSNEEISNNTESSSNLLN